MTVPTNKIKQSFACDGVTVAFPFTYISFYLSADLDVLISDPATGVETVLTQNTDYTVTPAGSSLPYPGGTITLIGTYAVTPPAAGITLVVYRDVPYTQEIDLVAGGAMPAATLEEGYDRGVMMLQQIYERLNRTVTLPISSPFSGMYLPLPAALQFLRWNAAGDNLENIDVYSLGDLSPVSAWALTFLGNATKAEGRATLGLPVHCSSEYASLAAFVTAIGTTEAVLVIDRDETVAIDTTIPATVAVCTIKGRVVTVNTGVSLTINGSFQAGACQAFDCAAAGSRVYFGAASCDCAYPDWFGQNTTPGTTDMTAAFTAAMYAHKRLRLLPGTDYGMTTVTIPSTLREFDGARSTIKCLSYTSGSAGVIVLDRGCMSLDIHGVILNVNSQHYRGIVGVAGGYNWIHIHDNYVYGLVVSDTVEPGTNFAGAGIRLNAAYEDSVAYQVYNIRIWNNTVYLPVVTIASGFTSSGIAVYGEFVAYAGYFTELDGTFTPSRSSFESVTISGNHVYDGTHGIELCYGGSKGTVTGNVVTSQSHRGIALSGNIIFCNIAGNVIMEYGSSAVMMSYGCQYNVVASNTCRSAVDAGEGSIQAYVGCEDNLITGNLISAPKNYGVYLAIGAANNQVSGNTITGYILAAIAIESDWQSPNPAGATYSRPTYGAPAAGSYWAYLNTSGNRILGNTIGVPKSGATACGIYLSGTDGPTGTATVTNGSNYINNNVIITSLLTHELFAYSETAGNVVLNVIKGNTFITKTKFSFSHPVEQFTDVDGNTFLNYLARASDATNITGATPSVAYGKYFQCANSGATSLTNFTNGRIGQEIVVRLDSNTTIVHGSSTIRLKGGVNATGTSDNHICLRLLGTIWFEQWRSF